MKLNKEDLKLGVDIDTIGEHLVNASFKDSWFNQTFEFLITVILKERKSKISF